MTLLLDDERALYYIDAFFGESKPGQVLSHLLVAYESPNALGVPELKSAIYGIAPDGGNFEVHDLILRTIVDAKQNPQLEGELVFAVMFLEVSALAAEDIDARATALQSRGRLDEHERAYEKTIMYAAACDGRRWSGDYYITGPKAGTKEGPIKYVYSGLADDERGPMQRLIRRIVGLTW
jgi:hypothetical protein